MKLKHSQGKWFACCLDAHHPHFIFTENKTICGMNYNDPSTDRFVAMEDVVTVEECKANARLIQAAPELLNACIESEKHHQGLHSEIGAMLREIIKKATE